MNKRTVAAAVLTIGMVALTACSSENAGSETDMETITIGSVHPLSGNLAGVGGLMNDGAKMAVEDINAAGGIASLDGAQL
ncbi:MAG: ABC transporter substrate-binding protein, partial [Arthrobacter sp.]